jgi:hypothetical protein
MNMTVKRLTITALLLLLSCTSLFAQLDERCTVSILNRTAQVQEGGVWVVRNVPANLGRVRARATCLQNGVTKVGQSAFFSVPANGVVIVPEIVFAQPVPVPATITLSAPNLTLSAPGATVQLTTTATDPNGAVRSITTDTEGTSYTTSNIAVATVSSSGLVTATGSGLVILSATNEGALALIRITVAGATDLDNDGLPNDFEIANGLNPNDPSDAARDEDGDGLTNLAEYQLGTNIRAADTDGDGIRDGLEVQSGSDPLNPASYNLSRALRTVVVTPFTVALQGNPLFGDVSQQLVVSGNLLDGTTIDLTSTSRGTTYTSNNLLVCNFSPEPGRLFAGANGDATVTVAVGGFSTLIPVTVQVFNPIPRGSVLINGYANNVKVLNGYAYVAAGWRGIQIVDVSDRSTPVVVNVHYTWDSAYDLRIVGDRIYVADGAAGLYIASIASDPSNPEFLGRVDTRGDAQDVVVDGNYAYVADGGAGLAIIDVADPARPLVLSTVATTGRAKGVSYSNGYAVVVTGDARDELIVVDVRNPLLPVVTGTVAVDGELKDVVARGSLAYIAAYTEGLQIVDFSTPTAPRVVGAVPNAFVTRDLALLGNTAVMAEQLFPHALPFVDISNPANPIFRGIIDLTPLGDFAETGIDVDSSFVYTTAEAGYVGQDKGNEGYTALFIAQYAAVDDGLSRFPTAHIDSPTDGASVIAGTKVPITITATDDQRVQSVALYANGAQVAVTKTPPFTMELAVPLGGPSTIALHAIAVDFGSRPGQSSDIILHVVPDPLTTLTGLVLGPTGTPHAGARVTLPGRGQTTTTGPDGRYSFTNLSSIDGAYEVYADVKIGVEDYDARLKAILPVHGGITNAPDLQLIRLSPVVDIIMPPQNGDVSAGVNTWVWATAHGLYPIASITVTLDGVPVRTDSGDDVYIPIPIPAQPGTFHIGATATDVQGHAGVAEEIIVYSVPDPLTTVQGTVHKGEGGVAANAAVTLNGGATTTTDAAGKYTFSSVSTLIGDLRVEVSSTIDGELYSGASDYRPPSPGGIVVLDVTIQSIPIGVVSDVYLGGSGNGVDVQGSFVYAASGLAGLRIADVSNPRVPADAGYLPLPLNATDVKVAGNVAYVAAGNLHVVDVTNPRNPQLLATLATLNAWELQVQGHIVVTVGAEGFATVDVSNPASPRVLGKITEFNLPMRALALSGSLAIVVEHSLLNGTYSYTTNLLVIDFSRPDAPAIVGRLSVPTGGRIHDVVVRGMTAYLAESGAVNNAVVSNAIEIVDFSNPTAPVLHGTYTQPDFYPIALAVHGDSLIVAGGRSGEILQRMQVLDARYDPPLPVTGLSAEYGAIAAVVAAGDYVYGLTGANDVEFSTNSGNDMVLARYRLIEDRTIVAPTVTVTQPQQGATVVEGSLVAVDVNATDDHGVNFATTLAGGIPVQTFFNVPSRVLYRIPNGAGSFTFDASATDFAGHVTAAAPVTVTVTADPRTTVRGSVLMSFGGPAANVTVTIGALSTVTDAGGSYTIADVPTTDPQFIVGARAVVGGEILRGASAAIAPVSGGLTTVPPITIAPLPVGPISSLAAWGYPNAVAVRGTMAYVSSTGGGFANPAFFQVVDFSNVEAPRVVGKIAISASFAIALSGNYAYLGGHGVTIIDISDPTQPAVVGNIPVVGVTFVSAVAVSGSTVYAAAANGIIIFDASNPAAPVLRSALNFGGIVGVNDILVSGGYAYIAAMRQPPGGSGFPTGGLYIVDVLNPSNPILISQTLGGPTLPLQYEARGLAMRNNTVYVATVAIGASTPTFQTLAVDVSNKVVPTVLRAFAGFRVSDVSVEGRSVLLPGVSADGRPILGVIDATASAFTPYQTLEITHGADWFPATVGTSGDIGIVPGWLGAFSDKRLFFVKYTLLP